MLLQGFTDYMRDYEVIVAGKDGPPFDDVHRYQFVACVEANPSSTVAHDVLSRSIDDRFVYSGPDFPDKPEPDGFIWGTRYSTTQSGIELVDGSYRSQQWSEKLGLKMHEVTIHTEAFHLRLVFHELRLQFLGKGTAGEFVRKQFPIASAAT